MTFFEMGVGHAVVTACFWGSAFIKQKTLVYNPLLSFHRVGALDFLTFASP